MNDADNPIFFRIDFSGNYAQERKRPLIDNNALNPGLLSWVRSEKWRETHILRLSRISHRCAMPFPGRRHGRAIGAANARGRFAPTQRFL